jgi:hypothetical protein
MREAGRDYRDLIGGAILIVVGIAGALYASSHYPMGTVQRMGPGMFPVAIGYLLAGLGVLIALPAWIRRGTLPMPEFRPFLLVLASVLIFAITIERLGMVPAIFLLTGLAVLADDKLGIIGTIVLAAALSLGAWLIFVFGLGIPIYAFIWPF